MINKSKKAKVCLSMIVKNESHVIKETLQNISKYIDYYVINDTGSTDNTKEIIKEYFDSVNIEGEIIDHEFRTCKCHMGKWKKYSFFHFGWNRSFALNQCVNNPISKTADYILVFDADDLIVGDMDLTNLKDDCYDLQIGKGFTYKRPLLFKNDKKFNWRFEDPLHEYATGDGNYTKGDIGGCYVDSRRLGSRNQDKDKYLKDALVFEELLKDNPNNDRHVFYCAQSYYDCKDYLSAIKYYKKRISLGKWYEEVYYSYYKIALALVELKRPWLEIKKAFLDAYNYCKDRAEPLYEIARHYRLQKDYVNGYEYAKAASLIKYPEKCKLFIYKNVYDHHIFEELSICAFELGKYQESLSIAKKINNKKIIEKSMKKINEIEKKVCVIYTGNLVIDESSLLYSMIQALSETNKIIIIGNKVNIYSYENVVALPVRYFKDLNMKIIADYLFLCDNIDLFYDNLSIECRNVILLLQDSYIKSIYENGLTVGIQNCDYLNKIFDKLNISRIICNGKDVYDSFLKNYGELNIEFCDFEDESNSYILLDKGDNESNKYKFDNDISNDCNGLIYFLPDTIKILNNKIYDFSKSVIMSYYKEIQKKHPFILEHLGKIAQIHFEFGEYNEALININLIVSLIKENPFYQKYKDMIQLYKSNVLYKLEKYSEAYDICNTFLNKDTIPKKQRVIYEELRDKISGYLTDRYIEFQNSFKDIKATNNNKIMLYGVFDNISTFEKMMNSFLQCCLDKHMIDSWVISCNDCHDYHKEIKEIKKKYPFVTTVIKKNNINNFREEAILKGFKYVFYLGSGWQFIQKRNYITECIDKITDNDNIYGVGINNNLDGLELHLLSVKVLKEGGIINTEGDYIDELKALKYESAYINTVVAIKLLEFNKNINSTNFDIVVISKDINNWRKLKESVNGQIIMKRVVVKECIDFDRKLFLENNFNYLREVISEIMIHLNILKSSGDYDNNYTMVIKDNVILKKDFKGIINNVLKHDLIFLDSYGSYIISKNGKRKLLDYFMNNGIQDINFLEKQKVVEPYVLDKSIFEENGGNEGNNNKFFELEGYKFYSLMDSFGNDSSYISSSYNKTSINKLKLICDKSNCKGFNTLGYIKNKICDEKDFIILPGVTESKHGLYVKL